MVDNVSWDTIDSESHGLCNFTKGFCFHLMPVSKSREIGAFAMNMALYQGKASANGIEWDLVFLAVMSWHINELDVCARMSAKKRKDDKEL